MQVRLTPPATPRLQPEDNLQPEDSLQPEESVQLPNILNPRADLVEVLVLIGVMAWPIWLTAL
jgi:hypothetical protein